MQLKIIKIPSDNLWSEHFVAQRQLTVSDLAAWLGILNQTAPPKSRLEKSFCPVIYERAGSQCTLFNSL